MELNEEFIEKFLEELSSGNEINISDIPCIDLYMDQVTSFFENKLEAQRRNDEDKILTKTMINNYTKAKILMPAKNKKYTRDHMILLALIYNLKQILSINDIDSLFSSFFPKKEEGLNEDIADIYQCFLKIKENENDNFTDYINKRLQMITEMSASLNIEDKAMAEMFLTVLTLINSANMKKRLAEKIIDQFFTKDKKEK